MFGIHLKMFKLSPFVAFVFLFWFWKMWLRHVIVLCIPSFFFFYRRHLSLDYELRLVFYSDVVVLKYDFWTLLFIYLFINFVLYQIIKKCWYIRMKYIMSTVLVRLVRSGRSAYFMLADTNIVIVHEDISLFLWIKSFN